MMTGADADVPARKLTLEEARLERRWNRVSVLFLPEFEPSSTARYVGGLYGEENAAVAGALEVLGSGDVKDGAKDGMQMWLRLAEFLSISFAYPTPTRAWCGPSPTRHTRTFVAFAIHYASI